MNHKQRRKVRQTLLAYRRKTQRTPEDIAESLGWPVAFYLEAEAGKAGLSPGQKQDVKAMIQKEIKAATIRDEIRGTAKAKRVPLIGGTRIVPVNPTYKLDYDPMVPGPTFTGQMPAPWIDTQNMSRDPEDALQHNKVRTGWVDPETGEIHMNEPKNDPKG